ncbi:MAG: helix-turn-helix domain-containing protein [Velocimicrobium sp.]
MNERIKELRKIVGMTQEIFAKQLGLARNSIASYESGSRTPMDSIILSICREFKVNEEWIRYGTGDMFKEVLPEDETAALVSELLEKDNPFYDIIKEIMHTYGQCSEKSQEVIDDFSKQLLINLKKRERED